METIGDNYKKAINSNFLHNLIERSADGIANALNINVRGSENMSALPNVEGVKLEKIDEIHDKLTLLWADYKVEGVVSWKPSANKLQKSMVFYGIE